MGSFKIHTTNPQTEIRFAQQKRELPQLEKQPPQAQHELASDAVRLSATTQRVSAQPKSLEEWLSAPEQKSPNAQDYMARLTTRKSGFELGSEHLQMAVGLESEAPTILTRDRDPSLSDTLHQQYGRQPKSTQSIQQLADQETGNEQLIHAGARIQPIENLHLQVGIASRLDAQQLMSGTPSPDTAMNAGVYASAAYQTAFVSSQISVDTAYGKPRVEVGAAINAGEVATVGLSYQHTEHNEEQKLRFGTEVRATQDTALGVSVYQPIKAVSDTTQTAVGVYLNTRFD